MNKRVLLTATVQSHICQFHKPLMKLLKEHGYEVHVAARDNLAEKNGLAMEYADRVFDVFFDRSPFSLKNIKAYKELSEILKDNKYDIIHTNTPMGGMVTRLAANKYRKKNGTKVFYTAHGFHFYKGAPKKNWLIYYPIEKFMSLFTDVIVTITYEDYELAKRKFLCKVIHMHGVGADSERFYPVSNEEKNKFRHDLGYSNNSKIILNVGELNSNKNQKIVVKSMEKIVEKFPDAVLLIAGNGPEKETLNKLIENLGLEKNIKLLGYTTEIFKYMSICDVLAACSYREGLPLNLMEAMLCGKPIVASKNRGHKELIKDGYNGFLVDVENTEAFSDKILEVMKCPAFFAENALNFVKPFTDKNVLKELKELYNLK